MVNWRNGHHITIASWDLRVQAKVDRIFSSKDIVEQSAGAVGGTNSPLPFLRFARRPLSIFRESRRLVGFDALMLVDEGNQTPINFNDSGDTIQFAWQGAWDPAYQHPVFLRLEKFNVMAMCIQSSSSYMPGNLNSQNTQKHSKAFLVYTQE